mmetsp:Transcript_6664/g.9585  ORF Transcript_6664/g.9585 Transcript_6664/m.9585 type:complete len:251 (+) Transcript_6664:2-754(+)
MPIHYGSRALNYQTISSPLGTQLPQAVGSAYKYKIEGRPNIAIAFFGEGCASTNDFHSACSFASTLKVPCIFFCRNNGYAISTPSKEQYAGDGVISRCKGYGMAGIRIDGNDVFAVAAAVRKAKEYALENSAPVLIEAMTYRQGHHSTSDDSSQYRDSEEVKGNEEHGDPMRRFNMFLDCVGWMSEADAEVIRKEERKSVLKALHTAEKRGPPPLKDMFEDVYKEMPKSLMEQQKSLEDHMAKYASRYTQ